MLCQKFLFVSQINLLYKQEKPAYYYTGTQYITISSFSTSTTRIRRSHFSSQQAEKQTCPTVKNGCASAKNQKKNIFCNIEFANKEICINFA